MVVANNKDQPGAANSPEMLPTSFNVAMNRFKELNGDSKHQRSASNDCSLTGRLARPAHGFTLGAPAATAAKPLTELSSSTFVHSHVQLSERMMQHHPTPKVAIPQTSAPHDTGEAKGVETTERLQRSRERNRIHARKTRLRKKEQMQTLQGKADVLKSEQIRLKQVINEKNTASILVGLFATSGAAAVASAVEDKEDPRVEELLRRPTSDIPDSTNITELPSLILPGQHASKKMKACSNSGEVEGLPEDGIDYGLLGKDRSKCSPEELDRIRRERNRMHAKRTRDRKRMFMEELGEICRKLEEENETLRAHLYRIDPDYVDPDDLAREEDDDDDFSSVDDASEIANELSPSLIPSTPSIKTSPDMPRPKNPDVPRSTVDQIKTLLAAATSFERPLKRALVAVSSDDSNDESAANDQPMRLLAARRRRYDAQAVPRASLVPTV